MFINITSYSKRFRALIILSFLWINQTVCLSDSYLPTHSSLAPNTIFTNRENTSSVPINQSKFGSHLIIKDRRGEKINPKLIDYLIQLAEKCKGYSYFLFAGTAGINPMTLRKYKNIPEVRDALNKNNIGYFHKQQKKKKKITVSSNKQKKPNIKADNNEDKKTNNNSEKSQNDTNKIKKTVTNNPKVKTKHIPKPSPDETGDIGARSKALDSFITKNYFQTIYDLRESKNEFSLSNRKLLDKAIQILSRIMEMNELSNNPELFNETIQRLATSQTPLKSFPKRRDTRFGASQLINFDSLYKLFERLKMFDMALACIEASIDVWEHLKDREMLIFTPFVSDLVSRGRSIFPGKSSDEIARQWESTVQKKDIFSYNISDSAYVHILNLQNLDYNVKTFNKLRKSAA